MVITNSTPAAPKSRTERLTREARGIQLFEEHGHQTTRVIDDLYMVPSSDGSTWYKVVYGGDEERCSCPAFAFNPSVSCKHLICLGIAHGARRSGVLVRTTTMVIAGDPFAHAAKRRDCSLCFGGYVTITVEEDGVERDEAVPCRRCADSR